MTLRVFSYGGGVQSTAALVLAARGEIDFPVFLFSNVGDDSEHPKTIAYVHDVAMPYAAEHGLELAELHRRNRAGEIETLWGRAMKEGSRSIPLPVRMSNGAPGNRSCTADHKIRVVAAELKRRGATPDNPATVGVGISTDELERVSNRRESPIERVVYPLIDLGISRDRCAAIIRDAGLEVPPKSSCFFCPFHRPATWQQMAREEPELFEKSVLLERTLTERRRSLPCLGEGSKPEEAFRRRYVEASLEEWELVEEGELDEIDLEDRYEVVEVPYAGTSGTCPRCHEVHELDAGGRLIAHGKDPVFLTRFGKPLDEAIDTDQLALFTHEGPEGCDSGYCWT